jgi:hypothetical protein
MAAVDDVQEAKTMTKVNVKVSKIQRAVEVVTRKKSNTKR